MFKSKRGAASLALITVSGLFALKVAVAILTGSISILAQMADSALDILSVSLTFIAVVMATKPADTEHPFGHGKLENLSAIVQAIFIFTAAAAIIYSAVQRIINGAAVELAQAGMAVMAVSILASLLLSRHLRRVAGTTDSPALSAISNNISADVFSATGVLAGLLVVSLSDGRLAIFDPILAILVSLLILRSGVQVIRHSFGALIDARLPPEEEKIIRETILEHNSQLVGLHELRSRKSGSQRHVDLHLVMPRMDSVAQAHDVCDHLESDLKARLPNLNVIIHVEPCDSACERCDLNCSAKK
jgi:cation diffusion facilitator family transporter